MEIYEKARLAQLAARLRQNVANGNVANTSTPGAVVRPQKSSARSSSAPTAAPATPLRKTPITLPPAYAKLTIDVDELVPHLSNARELYTAKSAVSKTANQLYGTMVDVLQDSGDMEDCMLEDDAAMIEEGDMELEAEAVRSDDHDEDAGDESSELGGVAGSELDASA
jgi:hypothetical protein